MVKFICNHILHCRLYRRKNSSKPPPQIPWIGDKRVGLVALVYLQVTIFIGVSRDPENPQIKIKQAKGRL